MANDSTVAGYLVPVQSPIYGDALDDVLHDVIAGITGIAGNLIRPRWQPEPPNQPDLNTDWVAFGINNTEEDIFAFTREDANGLGTSIVERDEKLYYLISFYGPDSTINEKQFSAAIQLAQNRDALTAQNIGFVEMQKPVVLPALLKEKWVRRIDATLVLRRRVGWTFQVRTVASASAGIDNEIFTTQVVVSQ